MAFPQGVGGCILLVLRGSVYDFVWSWENEGGMRMEWKGYC